MKSAWLKTGTAAAIAAALVSGCGMMDHHAHGSSAAAASGTESVRLSGASEVPPVSTSASGSGTVTVGADCSVKATVTATGMAATAAHIHEGAAGANGGVAGPLNKTGGNAFAPGRAAVAGVGTAPAR